MALGQRNKFGVPKFEPKVFREQMYFNLLKKVFVTLLGIFGAPTDSTHGALRPFATPRYSPAYM